MKYAYGRNDNLLERSGFVPLKGGLCLFQVSGDIRWVLSGIKCLDLSCNPEVIKAAAHF